MTGRYEVAELDVVPEIADDVAVDENRDVLGPLRILPPVSFSRAGEQLLERGVDLVPVDFILALVTAVARTTLPLVLEHVFPPPLSKTTMALSSFFSRIQ